MDGNFLLLVVMASVCGLYVAWMLYRRLVVWRRARGLALKAGGLYSVAGKKGYQVAKVLVLEEDAVHIRLYKQRFEVRPQAIDPATLTLGTIHDPDGFGLGHLPLTRSAFFLWNPVLISSAQVTEDELEGYRVYKEAGGGGFGA